MRLRYAAPLLVGWLAMVLDGAITQADILVSNLAQPFRASTPIANPEYWGAQSFLTGSNPFQITSIEVIGGNGAASPNIVAELRAATGPLGDIDTSSGGLIGTFSAPDMTGSLAVRLFSPTGLLNLNPSTKYWFVLGADSGAFDWSYADTNLSIGPGDLANFAQSVDAGASWTHYDDAHPFYLQVNGTSSIPEPATGTVIGIGLVGLMLTQRRRR